MSGSVTTRAPVEESSLNLPKHISPSPCYDHEFPINSSNDIRPHALQAPEGAVSPLASPLSPCPSLAPCVQLLSRRRFLVLASFMELHLAFWVPLTSIFRRDRTFYRRPQATYGNVRASCACCGAVELADGYIRLSPRPRSLLSALLSVICRSARISSHSLGVLFVSLLCCLAEVKWDATDSYLIAAPIPVKNSTWLSRTHTCEFPPTILSPSTLLLQQQTSSTTAADLTVDLIELFS